MRPPNTTRTKYPVPSPTLLRSLDHRIHALLVFFSVSFLGDSMEPTPRFDLLCAFGVLCGPFAFPESRVPSPESRVPSPDRANRTAVKRRRSERSDRIPSPGPIASKPIDQTLRQQAHRAAGGHVLPAFVPGTAGGVQLRPAPDLGDARKETTRGRRKSG